MTKWLPIDTIKIQEAFKTRGTRTVPLQEVNFYETLLKTLPFVFTFCPLLADGYTFVQTAYSHWYHTQISQHF